MEPELIQRLKTYGLSQGDLARCLGVVDSTVSQWCSGTRKLPQLILDDLWELFRLVEERTAAGMDVHHAVQGWQPTVHVSPGGRTTMGAPVSVPREAAEIAAKEGPAGTERLVRDTALAALVKAMEHPQTAEDWATIRRLALTVKLFADGALRFKEWEETDAD